MKISLRYSVIFAIVLATTVVDAQTALVLRAEDAIHHVGQHATVCGKVANTKYAASSRGQPTFVNLDKPYPNHVFTIVIWGNHRHRFGTPEIDLAERDLCVSGRIGIYRGRAQIEVRRPEQIQVEMK